MTGGLLAYPEIVLGPNLLTNGDIESTPHGWTLSSAFSVDSTVAHGGVKSLKMDNAPGYPYAESASRNVTLTPGYYRIGGFIKLDNIEVAPTKGVRIALRYIGSTSTINGTQDWTESRITSLAVTTAGSYNFRCEAYNEPTGTAWFDDLYIQREAYPLFLLMKYPNYRGMLYTNDNIVVNVKVDASYLSNAVRVTLLDEDTLATIHTADYAAQADFDVEIPYTGMSDGENYLVRISLVSGGATVYTHPDYRVIKSNTTAKDANVLTFSKDNRLLKLGERFFMNGVYDSGLGYNYGVSWWESFLTTERRLFELPLNTYLNYWYPGISDNTQQMKDFQDACHNHGVLTYLTANCFSANMQNSYFQIEKSSGFLAGIDRDNTAGVYIADECTGALADDTLARHRYMCDRKEDGANLSILFANASLPMWPESGDLLGTDPYTMWGAEPIGGYPFYLVEEWVAATRDAVQNSKPYIAVLQFFKGYSSGRFPTAAEMKNMWVMAVANGAQGILWWSMGNGNGALQTVCTGWCTEKNTYFDRLKDTITEINLLEDVLVQDDVIDWCTCDDDMITFVVRKLGDTWYLFASNPTPDARDVTFTPGTSVLDVIVYNEDRIIEGGETFSDTFSAYEAHIYSLEATAMAQTLSVDRWNVNTSPNRQLEPQGIASTETHGYQVLNFTSSPLSIASAEVFGALNLTYDQNLIPLAIYTSEAFGTAYFIVEGQARFLRIQFNLKKPAVEFDLIH